MCGFGSLSPHSKKPGGSNPLGVWWGKVMRWMHCAPFLQVITADLIRWYFAIGGWNSLPKTVISDFYWLSVCSCNHLTHLNKTSSFFGSSSPVIDWKKFKGIPNNQPNDEAAWCQQQSFNVRRTSPSQRWRLNSYLRNCRRSTTRGQDRLSTQMPNWAALLWDGTRCCCAGPSYKRVTLRHDSLTLWLISFSLLQPASAIPLFWLFLLHLSDWLNRAKLHLGLFSEQISKQLFKISPYQCWKWLDEGRAKSLWALWTLVEWL